jgi:hypothetical protein
MPDERQEIRIKRPASHTMLSAFYCYTTVCGGVQGDVYELGSLALGAEPRALGAEPRALGAEPSVWPSKA